MAQSQTPDLRELRDGKTIAKRWLIVKKLGEGGMGCVFKVEDKKRKSTFAAMKVEFGPTEGGILKLEAHILNALKSAPLTLHLLDSGSTAKFCFIVMPLCGHDLMQLRFKAKRALTEGTSLRIAVLSLYAIKQIHEVGFVHRDIKPGNIMTGLVGRDSRMLYVIDYGMARSFITKDANGNPAIRKPRGGEQMYRGTPRYCSMAAHQRRDQGRVDDLWGWLHTLVELHCGLPWRDERDETKIAKVKGEMAPEKLCERCPVEFLPIHKYLTILKYESRPDYFAIYTHLLEGIKRCKSSFMYPYEWEDSPREVETALSISENSITTKKPATKVHMARRMYPQARSEYFKENVLGF